MPKPAESKLLPLVFESAAIFAGSIRPRIELPAPAFLCDPPPKDDIQASPTLEIIERNGETKRDRFLGVANPEHVLLVLPSDDFERLSRRVSTIRKKPLKFELTVDEHGQLLAVVVDGKPVHLPHHRSGVTGELDYDIDQGSGGQAAG